MQFTARLPHIMSSLWGLAVIIYQLFNNSLLVQPWSMVANGICNEADLWALSNLERLLSGSMIIMVIFKSHVKPEESWWKWCESRGYRVAELLKSWRREAAVTFQWLAYDVSQVCIILPLSTRAQRGMFPLAKSASLWLLAFSVTHPLQHTHPGMLKYPLFLFS